ncbi:ABC transporter permease [Halolamina sp. C58]|uniref:ABC transporter permease n=1 Tax=Halolamina sp. C58 TaxID=3421640 RepID=UPI003EB7245B
MSRAATAFAISLREHARNYVLLGLLVVLPVSFITLAFAVTQDGQIPVRTLVDGEMTTVMRGLPAVHGVIMTPITSALIAGLAGLFLMHEAKDTDGRLVSVGYRARQVVAARFGVLAAITLVVTGVSVGVLLVDFTPEHLWWFVAAMLVLSATYGLVGMLVGTVFDRLAGMWLMLILPMLDVGLFQDPLFVQSDPDWWMTLLPGYHSVRVMVDVALTTDVDAVASLGWAVGYLAVVAVLTIALFYRKTGLKRD